MSLYGGPDWSSLNAQGQFDLDPNFGELTDPFRLVAEHILRRWKLQPGELDVQTIGVGIDQYFNGSFNQSDLGEIEANLRNSALEVDGLADISLQVSFTDLLALNITAQITLDDAQSFETIFQLTPDSIQLIVDGAFN